MKGTMRAVWLGTVLGLTVVLFGTMILFQGELGWGSLFVIVISAFLGLLICLPVADALARLFMNRVYAVHKGKVSKDFSRAKRLLAEERFAEAMGEFRRAVEEEPENVSLRLEIAEIYSRDLREYEKAIGEYEEALTLGMLDSQRVSILNRVADLYEGPLRDQERAARTLSRIIQLFPGTGFAERAEERIAGMAEGQEGLADEVRREV